MPRPNEQGLRLAPPKGFVTHVDPTDVGSNYLLEARGFREARAGMIVERDFGCKHRYETYPLTNADIPGVDLVGGYSFIDKTTGIEHDVVVAIDSLGDTHIFVQDGNDWVELTKKLLAVVSSVPGANTIIVTLSNITRDGQSYVPTADELNGYIVVNLTRGDGSTAELAGISDNGGFVRFSSNGHPFAVDDVLFIRGARGVRSGTLNGYCKITASAANDFTTDIVWNATMTLTANATAVASRSILHVVDSTAASITMDTIIGTNGASWQNGDELAIYQFNGTLYEFQPTNGATPHIRWNPIEPLRKVNLLYGTSDLVPTMRDPLRIYSRESTDMFFPFTGAAQLNFPAGWALELGNGGLTPSRYEVGSPTEPITGAMVNAKEFIYEQNASEPWAAVQINPVEVTYAETMRHLYLAVCVEFDGYQVSAPVLYFFVGPFGNFSITTSIVFYVNPALMPKNVTGFHVFQVNVSQSDIDSGLHKYIPASSYLHAAFFGIADRGEVGAPYWLATVDTSRGGLSRTSIAVTLSPFAYGLTATLDPMDSMIGHNPTKERQRYRPRFAAKAARSQGSVTAIDKNDQELLMSVYAPLPDLTHLDDQFVDVTLDVSNAHQKVILNSRGQLLGLAFTNVTSRQTGLPTGVLAALKTTEIEFFDIARGEQWIIQTDVYAGQSITQTPHGIAWLGRTGVYLLPNGAAEPISIGQSIQNLLDGTLKCDDNLTERITDAYRKAAIMAWDYYYHHLWLHIQVNKKDGSGSEYTSYRYSPEARVWLGDRKVNIGGAGRIYFFGSRNDGTLSIGDHDGIRKYPNLTGDFPYEDDVNADDTSNSKGIPTRLLLSLGEIHGIIQRAGLTVLRFLQDGESVTKKGRANVRFSTHPFPRVLDTQLLPVDEKEFDMGVDQSLGALNNLQVEIELPESSLTDFKRWGINGIEAQNVPQMIEEIR